MNQFSISQLSQFSGIKPHTLRVWEQRYSALKPSRSEGNTRYYDGNQLRRLLNIVSLLAEDGRVSDLCKMTDKQLADLVLQKTKTADDDDSEYFVSQLISAGVSYELIEFEDLFERCLLKYGLIRAYQQVIYPMLSRIGLMWAGSVLPSAQEHFMTSIVRRKVLKSIDALPRCSITANKWLLFLPEDEFHEIGLIVAEFFLKHSGHETIYLGSSVSKDALISAVTDTEPDYLLLFLTHYNLPETVQRYLDDLGSRFKNKTICLAGNEKLLNQLKFTQSMVRLNTIESLDKFLGNTLCVK